MFVPSALAIAAGLWIAYLVALAVEKRIFDQAIRRWKSLSKLGKGVVALVLIGFIAFAGTKPPSGDGGGSDSGDDPAITNVVEGAEGDATLANGDGEANESGEAVSSPLVSEAQGEPPLSEPSSGMSPSEPFSSSGEDTASPLLLASTPDSRICYGDYEAGFVLQSVGTNETFDFSAPEGAFVATNWMLHGAANARIHTDLKDWTFPFGNDFVTNLAAFASGVAYPDVSNPDIFFAPFAAPLGVVPSANWDQISGTGVSPVQPGNGNPRPASNGQDARTTSLFWRMMTPSNTLVCTWQNVLLDRMPTNPVSFQVEFRPGGSFIYRYDLSRLASDDLLTNVTVGVKNGDGAWFAPAVGRSLTSLRFARVTLDDLINPDRDGDGVPTEVELFDLGTDPDLADSDFDGKSDGEEIATGTNPNNRDSDNDGLVDGIDPDPTTSDTFIDEDEDGIDDNLERHYFGGTDVIDDPTEVKEDGFTLETEILAGINPTNAAPTPVTYITNSLVSWKLFDSFAIDTSTQPLTSYLLPLTSVLWQRSFRINKTSPWQQYFVSAAPDAAAGWMLEGMRLEWEDSNGNSGSVARSPSGDSWRIPLSTNATENVTLRLRATGAFVRTATPLHLIAYAPEVRFTGGREIRDEDGAVYSVFTNGSLSAIGLTVDRSRRPCRALLSAEESDPSVLFGMESAGDFVYSGDATGGEVRVLRPGFHPLPQTPAALSRPAVRRLLRNGNGGRGGLLVLSPSVWYGKDPCRMGLDLDYDWKDDCYTYVDRYPLNSSCLWRNWRKDVTGRYVCDCEPGVSAGVGDVPADVTTSLDIAGGRCVGTVSVCGVPVWSGEALHNAGNEDVCWNRFYDSELLTHLEKCQTCEDTCTGGVCKYGDEGTSLGSLAFKVCVGAPRKGQVSGFAWFKTDGPITVTPSTFLYTFRNDADVSVTTNSNYRHVVCGDFRGRDILIERVSDVTRLTVRDRASQTLDHTWEFSNENGSPARIRIRKISKLNNPLEDWTYVHDEGTWTRFDNLKQISEELYKSDGLNEPGDGAKRETRIVRDGEGNTLSYVYTESRRIGECENAVLRETYRSEWTGLNDRIREADYWYDPEHKARHGQLRLLTGNDRSWEYHDFDEFGREVLRVEQRNGSAVPSALLNGEAESFPLQGAANPADLLGNGARSSFLTSGKDSASPLSSLDAYVTVYDYTPLGGDDADADDGSRIRRETKYVVTGGTATVIERTWWRYTHRFSGYATVRAEKWRAGSSAGLSSPTAPGNAYSYEETFTDTATGIPLVLRNQVAESLDENGILTRNSYDIAQNVVTCTSRKYFVSSATNNQQPTTSNPLPTYTQTDFDSVYGLVLRTATYLTDGGMLLTEERSTYDEKNRLRSTTYSDGTSFTNAYSCCRLLWRRDREGRKTLRSAVTGYDQIYNADEEVWLADISTNGGYRVTQHFFDGLGRETNTLTCIGHVPGEAAVPSHASQLSQVSQSTTDYPYGGSDYAIHTDARGVETVTRTDVFENCTERCEDVMTNGVCVTLTITRSVYGGGTSTRREWACVTTAPSPSAPLWTEKSRFSDYTADGRRIEYAVTVSSDCGTVTNSIVVYDWLGREVSRSVPGANDTRIETRRFYDGSSDRIIRAETDGSPDVTYGYDARGELETTTQSGILNRSVTTYETVSGEVWQVRTSTKETGSTVNSTTIDRIQLTGLSDALRSRRESVSQSNVTRRESAFDPSGYLTTTTLVDDGTPETSVSRYGLEVSTTTLDGTETYEYDEQGRRVSVSSFAAGATSPRSREVMRYNAFGDLVETVTDLGADGSATATAVYDLFGREVSRTDAQGNTVTTEYDALGRVVSTSGDAYPIQTGYDSTGRKTRGATTRDGGNTWDETGWTYDPASGLNTAKRYADGSQIAYAYTDNGKKTRTTWARGVWKENAYDSDNRISGVTYSDATPSVQYAYNAADKVVEAATAGGAQFGYAYDDRLLCTNEAFGIGSDCFEVARDYDANRRAVRTSVIVTNVAHAVKSRWFDSENRVAGYALTNSLGRGVTATLAYDGSRMSGMTFALPNGGTFSTALTLNAARPDLVSRRAYSANGSPIYSYDTSFDLIGRPVNATDSQSLARSYLYNRRSELAAATIGTNAYEYAYDTIGNRTAASANSVTNTYAANALNQYTQIDASQLTYDNDGNMTQDDRFAYTYDAENRLISVRPISPTEGALAVVNAYDHKHRRVTKRVERFDGVTWQTVETHTFVYDGGNIVLEKIASPDGTTRTVEYFWGNDLFGTEQGAGGVGGLFAVSIDGAFFIPCYDHNGNVVCYVSESGTIAAQYVYDPYGNVIDQYGNMPDQFAFGFSTKYLDRETGLVGYQRRFYRPDHGRWLNRDPFEEDGGGNLYEFCGNCSVVFVDGLGCQIVVVRHLVGTVPPGGWGEGGRDYGQTKYRAPDILCKEIDKGDGKIGFEVTIDPPITLIHVYIREDESFYINNFNENQHIALYTIYDSAIEKYKRVVEEIVECPEEAYRLLGIARKNLLKVKNYVFQEDDKLDAPGGPHGH